jgi:hypothetical protein
VSLLPPLLAVAPDGVPPLVSEFVDPPSVEPPAAVPPGVVPPDAVPPVAVPSDVDPTVL